MKLQKFLSYFDFSYDICFADSDYERNLRQNLVDEGKLPLEEVDKPLIFLIDHRGINLGDIGMDRCPINNNAAAKIVERMDPYIQASVIREFTEALEDRNVDTSEMDLAQMITKCKSLGFGNGYVTYPLAEAVVKPKTIELPDLKRILHERT